MKTYLIIGILLVGMSGQAMSMGHPHNVFAARKKMRAKATASMMKAKSSTDVCWQSTVELGKASLSKRVFAALARVGSAQAY
ncbi:hypothetical protein ACFSUS_16975 [Spirosoma soli]|uniref:Uncharacterized protein n=1 Tax=Spirosoma soli TaxID=1770529 RepID=A0ABW5M7I8_9BACT